MYLEMIGAKQVVRESAPRYITENEKYLMSLQEVYYGKTKEIKDIEKKIGECREKYRTSPMKLNTAKEREELEELFCKAFGFECCQFTIDPSGLYNACTLPASSSITDYRDMKKYIVSKRGEGMKFTKEANVYLFILCTKGLFYSSNFTDAEITAILLHEVGHNFFTAITKKYITLHTINKVITLLYWPFILLLNGRNGLLLTTNLRNTYIDTIKKIRREHSELADAYWFINNFLTTLVGLGFSILVAIGNAIALLNPIGVLQNIPKQILNKLSLDMIFIPLGYRNEAIADEFASTYGYGAELSTALTKIEQLSGGFVVDQIYRDIPLINAYYDLLNLPAKVITNTFDEHPATIARANNQLKYNKDQLLNTKGLNPKMKKQIQSDIKDIEKAMDGLTNAEDQGFFFSNMYAKSMLTIFCGDSRNIFAKGVEDDFDSAQERAEVQYKQIMKK